MTPAEVGGLQSLAMANGGSLTINPHTGLPEAGFLKKLLPTLIGAFSNMFLPGIGALGAAALGGIAGGATNGWNLKGIGLGALGGYGGYGIGQGLSAAANPAAVPGADAGAALTPTPVAPDSLVGGQGTDLLGRATNVTGQSSGALIPTTSPTAGTFLTNASTPESLAAAPKLSSLKYMGNELMPLNFHSAAAEEAIKNQPGILSKAATAGKQGLQSLGQAGKGLQNAINDPAARKAFMDAAGRSSLLAAGASTAMGGKPAKETSAPGKKFQYYVTKFNQGTQNPNFGKPGHEGEAPILGMSYDPGYYTTENPFTSQPPPVNTTFLPTPDTQSGRGYGVGGAINGGINYPFTSTQPDVNNDAGYAEGGSVDSDINSYLNAFNQSLQGGNNSLSQYQPYDVSGSLSKAHSPYPSTATTGSAAAYNNGYMPGVPSMAYQPAYDLNWSLGTTAQPSLASMAGNALMHPISTLGGFFGFGGTGLDQKDNTKAEGGSVGYQYAGGGGIESLGHYSDGGRLLKGPGDGVSDDIPAVIHSDDGTKQEARLADGEFVFPARIVSEIGNGSTQAGADKLYAIMDKIQKDRASTLRDVARDTNADRHFDALMA
jgi:hypothetical protein